MADLSRQAHQPMTVVLADTAYCYGRGNHIIMSLLLLVLTNGNIPAMVALIICLQTMKFFQRTGFGECKTYFWRKELLPVHNGPRLRIQGSTSFVDPTKRDHGQCVQIA